MFESHTTHYRAIFISDFHIGAKTFNAHALLDFLKRTESDKLYLVGDIIDGWKLSKEWAWNDTYTAIFDELIRKVDSGTELVYLSGNHDDNLRHISLFQRLGFSNRFGFKITQSVTHKTSNGQKYLVIHGDQFDTHILSQRVLKTHHTVSNWLASISKVFVKAKPSYININGQIKKFSLAKYLSQKGRIAIQALNNFEGSVYKLVKSKNLNGIICGHTHIPVIKPIKDIIYANTGSWLRNGNTAIVETEHGNLSLIDWDHYIQPQTSQNQMSFSFENTLQDITDYQTVALLPCANAYRPQTLRLVRSIQKIWRIEENAPLAKTYPALKEPSYRPISNHTLGQVSNSLVCKLQISSAQFTSPLAFRPITA